MERRKNGRRKQCIFKSVRRQDYNTVASTTSSSLLRCHPASGRSSCCQILRPFHDSLHSASTPKDCTITEMDFAYTLSFIVVAHPGRCKDSTQAFVLLQSKLSSSVSYGETFVRSLEYEVLDPPSKVSPMLTRTRVLPGLCNLTSPSLKLQHIDDAFAMQEDLYSTLH